MAARTSSKVPDEVTHHACLVGVIAGDYIGAGTEQVHAPFWGHGCHAMLGAQWHIWSAAHAVIRHVEYCHLIRPLLAAATQETSRLNSFKAYAAAPSRRASQKLRRASA